MTPRLETERLILRPLTLADAPAIARGCGDLSVARMLTDAPHPYPDTMARDEISAVMTGGETGAHCAIALRETDALIGVTGIEPQAGGSARFGYWLGAPYHGNGFASEAVRALLDWAFDTMMIESVEAWTFQDNPGSRRVLEKAGFDWTGDGMGHSIARDGQAPSWQFLLTRARWRETRFPAPYIETERLVLNGFTAADAPALAAFAGRPEVARMMASIALPFGELEARERIERGRFRGRPGYRLAVRRRDTHALVGELGFGPIETPTVSYLLAPEQWGQGYATEAVRGFIADIQARFSPEIITAEAYLDNPASQRVLEKLGFVKTGLGSCESRARVAAEPAIAYALTAEISVRGQS